MRSFIRRMTGARHTDKTTREYYYSSKAALTFRILITRGTYTVTWKNKNEGRAMRQHKF